MIAWREKWDNVPEPELTEIRELWARMQQQWEAYKSYTERDDLEDELPEHYDESLANGHIEQYWNLLKDIELIEQCNGIYEPPRRESNARFAGVIRNGVLTHEVPLYLPDHPQSN